jgi:hypothetical protein
MRTEPPNSARNGINGTTSPSCPLPYSSPANVWIGITTVGFKASPDRPDRGLVPNRKTGAKGMLPFQVSKKLATYNTNYLAIQLTPPDEAYAAWDGAKSSGSGV